MPEEEIKPVPEFSREDLKSAEQVEMEEVLVEWRPHEYQPYVRRKEWFYLMGGIAAAGIIYAIIVRNWLLILIVGMLGVVVGIYTTKEPEKMEVAITKNGLIVNDRLYLFNQDLVSFWILYRPPELATLNFSRRGMTSPNISIQLEDQNPVKLRQLLLTYLPEDIEQEESRVDQISRRIGLG